MVTQVQGFFDEITNTVSYVAADPATGFCAIVDSVLDFDPVTGRTAHGSAEAIIRFVQVNGLKVAWILETHVHADHLSAAPYIRQRLGGRLAIGAAVHLVLESFGRIFGTDPPSADTAPFDHLFRDDEAFSIGHIQAQALATPGHTPACMTYLIGDAVFIGDTLFMPDTGTARCDFPGGDARQLYRSIRRILALPPQTRLFLCHDYKAPGRDDHCWETTVAAQRAGNIHIHDGVGEDDFVAMRLQRDATLAMPRLMLPSVQVNMRGGCLPAAEPNGVRYLKIPLDAF